MWCHCRCLRGAPLGYFSTRDRLYKRLKPWFFSKHHQCNRIFWTVSWRPVPYFLDTGFSTFLSGQVSISLDPEHCLDFSGYVRFPSLTRLLTSDISIAIQLHAHITATKQSSAAANFANRAHRQIWGPNVNINIYILSDTWIFINRIWMATRFRDRQIWRTRSGNSAILAPKSSDQQNREKTLIFETMPSVFLCHKVFYA